MSKNKSYFPKLIYSVIVLMAAIMPLAILGANFGPVSANLTAEGKKIAESLQIITMFYYVVFMPLIAFMLVLVVPFYVFKLQRVSNFVRVILLTFIVATLIFVCLQFLWLNINIDFVKQLYSSTSVWIFSWLVHVAIIILIIAPLIFEEESLFVSLVVSLILIIVSTNYVGLKFLTLLRTATKT